MAIFEDLELQQPILSEQHFLVTVVEAFGGVNEVGERGIWAGGI